MDLDLGIKINKEQTEFDIKPEEFKQTLKYLVRIDKVYPLDLQYLERSHTMLMYREEWKDENITSGSIVGISKDDDCEFYVQLDKFYDAAKVVFAKFLKNEKLVNNWAKKVDYHVSQIRKMAQDIKSTNPSSLNDKDLWQLLERFFHVEASYAFFASEQFLVSWGGFGDEKLQELFSGKEIKSSDIMAILVTQKYTGPAVKYNQGLNNIIDSCVSSNIEKINSFEELNESFQKGISSLADNFGWIRGSFNVQKFGIDGVISDINSALTEVRKIDTTNDEESQDKLKILEESFTEEEKRSLNLIVDFTVAGSRIIDSWLEMIVYTGKVFDEIADRIGLPVIDMKYLLLEELEEIFLKRKEIDQDIINSRKQGYILVFNEGKVNIITEDRFKEIKHSLESYRAEHREKTNVLKGQTTYGSAVVKGIVKIVNSPSDISKVNSGDILVSSATYPALLPAMRRAGAIVSELGGLLCHAAISSRELKIPCIVGVKNVTQILKDGDDVEINLTEGFVKKL